MKIYWMQHLLLSFLVLFFAQVSLAQIVVPARGCVIETFDGANPWVFGGLNSSWTWANPNKAEITDDITGGGKCLILGGNGTATWVNSNEDSWAESPFYDLSAVNSPYIEFWFYHSNEASTNFDEIWMEYSLNGGSSWQILSAPVGTNNCYDQNWYNFLDNWGGATSTAACCSSTGACNLGGGNGPSGWIQVRKCVASALANQPAVIFRFRSDNGNICNYYGATIDNFSVCDAKMVADFDYNCLGAYQVEFLDASDKCPDQWLWDFGNGVTDTQQNPVHSFAGPGTYTVTLIATATTAVTAGCGGPLADTISYTLSILDGAATLVSNVTCNAADDGIATANIIGGLPPYSYAWSNGANSQSASGLTPGAYSVTVTDGGACPTTHNITITEPPAITVSTTTTNTSCGSATGTMQASAAGGAGTGFSYAWSNAANTAVVSGVPDGTYFVTVTDATGCTSVNFAVVSTSGTTISVASTVTDATCNGSNGIIDLTPTSGTAPYSYIWSNAATTQDLSGLNAMTYSVTTTDVGGCNNVLNLTVGLIGPSDLLLDSIVNLTCNAAANGSVNISLIGTAPFNYLWSNGSTTEDLTAVNGGVYTITVVDGNSCQTAETFTITEPSAIVVTTDSISAEICEQLGAIDLSITGGAGSYSFFWTNNDRTLDISALNAGTYNLTVTDAAACQRYYSFIVDGFPIPDLVIDSIVNVSCNGGMDGFIRTNLSGGNPPFNYNWSNGQNTSSLNGLGIGTYTLMVTDSAGCTISDTVSITEPTALELEVAIRNASCVNNDGAGIAGIDGGVGGYQFLWDSGSTTQTASGLMGPSTISLTVTDANGCTISALNNSIGIDTTLQLTASISNLDCTAENIGSISLTPSNGAAPYQYLWTTGATTSNLNGLGQGAYALTVTDASGCSLLDTFVVNIPLIPTVDAFFVSAGIVDSTIYLSESIAIDAGNNQTAEGVTYQWMANPMDVDFENEANYNTIISPNSLGEYTLTVIATSLAGCRDSSMINLRVEEIVEPQFPTAFSPNNDGLNDLFQILSLKEEYILDLQIFNRWGQIVFDADESVNAWDGKFNGNEQPRDVYIYVLSYQRRTDANPIVVRGTITLLR